MDLFFQRYAGQNQFRHHIGVTWIAVKGERIMGFATVSPSSIEVSDLPPDRRRRLPHYPLPVLRLARLAVAQGDHGSGVGHLLLRAAFTLARELAAKVGCLGVVVDAKPTAVSWYERYGFRAMGIRSGALGDRPKPVPMFLHLKGIPGT